MILYFSGTGNSEYVAKRIGRETGDDVINLFDKIRNEDFSEIHSDRPWVVAAPVYAWRLPHTVGKWLKSTRLSGNKDIYFILTCGGSIGNAGKYLKALCTEKNMNYCGCAGITMPENYIAMFSTPGSTEALRIIENAENPIDRTALYIKDGNKIPQPATSLPDKLSSGIVNNLFYPIFVHAKKFYTTDSCISCGKCVNVFPLNNIHLESGKPAWSDSYTHCMACICRCPKEAVEYGNHSKGLPRYTCPKHL